MARDKLYEMYMSGKISALNIAKKDGIEALKRDIKKRNITKIIMDIPEKEIDRIFVELGENLRSTVMTIVYTVLHDVFDFRKVSKRYHMMKAERVIQELKENGYKEAAEFLGIKLS